jgi:PEP-CTERM motif
MSVQRGLRLALTLLAVGCLAGSQAKADFFAYTATVSVATAPTLPANPPGLASANIPIGLGNSLTFNTTAALLIDGSIPGGANINYGSVTFNPGPTAAVVAYDINFNYEVKIFDSLSTSGTVNFTGELKGFARGGANPAINGVFLNYAVNPAVLILDGKTFTISTGVNTGVGSNADGVLQGNVKITAVPEPASIALVGLGGFCLHSCNRRRKMKVA